MNDHTDEQKIDVQELGKANLTGFLDLAAGEIDTEWMIDILFRLLRTPSPSGRTDAVMQYIGDIVNDLGLDSTVTRQGTLVVDLPGETDTCDRALVVHADTIDMTVAWRQSRYDKGETEEERTAYINCPMTREDYESFIDALLAADKAEFHEGETAGYFDGCLPIEVMAERGRETLRHGPMKPVGLTNAHDPAEKPYAVVQLRRDNALGTLYNMVGFQTKMKYGAQTEVFRRIPGLRDAAFARLGGIHRNSFLNSPTLLDDRMRLRSAPHLRFAGQVTGVEGYVESAAMGLLAGRMAAAQALGRDLPPPDGTTAMGALVHHITGGAEAKTFQPMNVNFGLFPPVEAKGGRRGRAARYPAYTARAKEDFGEWLAAQQG